MSNLYLSVTEPMTQLEHVAGNMPMPVLTEINALVGEAIEEARAELLTQPA
jgi:hypothetical protein